MVKRADANEFSQHVDDRGTRWVSRLPRLWILVATSLCLLGCESTDEGADPPQLAPSTKTAVSRPASHRSDDAAVTYTEDREACRNRNPLRNAYFDDLHVHTAYSLKRREAFGTSGPRILPRFFGGWDYDAEACSAPNWVEIGYSHGVPMGGDLPAFAEGNRATFIAQAVRDPSRSGAPLQKLQIVKGCIDNKGEARY